MTHADSYGEARWRHGAFRELGWCGTQLVEPFFEMLEDEASEAIKGIVDGLHPGKTDWCPSKEYKIVETDISNFREDEFEETFLPDRDEWKVADMRAEVAERVARRQSSRTSAGLEELAGLEVDALVLEETEHVLAYELGERTVAVATSTCFDIHDADSARAVCLVDKAYERSVKLAKYSDTMCAVYGFHDVVCSANDAFAKGVEIYVGVGRQAWNSALSIVTGHPLAVKFDVGNRLCDAQRYFGAQASTLGSFLPVKKDARKAISKFFFMALEWPVENGKIANAGLVLMDNIARGNVFRNDDGAGASKAMYEYIEASIETWFKYWALVFESIGDIIEAYAEGGGALLYELRDMARLFGEGITDVFMDTALVYIELVGDTLRVFSGDTSKISDMVSGIFKAIVHTKTIIPRIAMKLAGLILESMGKLGTRSVSTFLCCLSSVIVVLTFALLKPLAHALHRGILEHDGRHRLLDYRKRTSLFCISCLFVCVPFIVFCTICFAHFLLLFAY